MTDKQVTAPEESAPVGPPPVWYPTPKRLSGPTGIGAAPPPLPPPGQFVQQAPAAGGTTPQPRPEQPPQYQWQWPSDDTPDSEYQPWQSGRAPAQSVDQPAPARRPWGEIEASRNPAPQPSSQNVWQYPVPGQPAWGTGYPPQQAQPQYAPGVPPNPQGYPLYVW